MIKPALVEIKNGDDELKQFIVTRLPASEGREVFTTYLTANLPKVGSYEVSEAMMLKLMSYVYVPSEPDSLESKLPLKTKALLNSHVTDWEMLIRLEKAMMEHNCSFFRDGKGLNFLETLKENLLQSATKTLTDLLVQSLQTDKQP